MIHIHRPSWFSQAKTSWNKPWCWQAEQSPLLPGRCFSEPYVPWLCRPPDLQSVGYFLFSSRVARHQLAHIIGTRLRLCCQIKLIFISFLSFKSHSLFSFSVSSFPYSWLCELAKDVCFTSLHADHLQLVVNFHASWHFSCTQPFFPAFLYLNLAFQDLTFLEVSKLGFQVSGSSPHYRKFHVNMLHWISLK